MRQEQVKNGSGGNRFISRLAGEKKKTAAAVCLITVMVIMWVRVFSKKMPVKAEAAATGYTELMNNAKSKLEITFIELPQVIGRNDVLTRDFFDADGWQNFRNDGRAEASYAPGNINDEAVEGIAKKLTLEAIVMGRNPQAFINDKLLSVGDKLPVREGSEILECEVSRIEEETVYIRCGETEITLKLTKAIEESE